MAPLPGLSVVTFTDGPCRLVSALLGEVRPIAHEIIVAVDERVPVEDLGSLQAVADRVVRAEFDQPLEANLAWLHSLATGDWILRLDSDDLVSEALCHRLSTPGWDRGLTHVYLQYRWLVDGGRRALAQAPWWPDPVLRLMRNDPSLVRFGHRTHELPTVAGAHQFWDEPLYHLDLVVRPEQERRAKVRRYERARPGLRTDAGWAVSPTYYLPEALTPPPVSQPIPAVDAEAIAQVLASASDDHPVPPTDLDALGPTVAVAHRVAEPPVPGDCRVRKVGPERLTVVDDRPVVVSAAISNLGQLTWDPTAQRPHVVGVRFFDRVGTQVGGEVREPLPGPIYPGTEALVRVPLRPHVPADAVEARIGLVQDGVGWHDGEAIVALQRVDGRRVLVSTGISATPHLGDDLIAAQVLEAVAIHLPDVVPVLLAHPPGDIGERFGVEVATRPIAAATARPGGRQRKPRDLVSLARRWHQGEPPDDPDVRAALAPFEAADALILAPGGGLTSRYADAALQGFALESAIARAFEVPVLIEGPSIGPLGLRRDQAAVAELLNAATRIDVRDETSASAARRIGRDVHVEVVPDPATAALPADPVDRDAARRWRHARNIGDERPYVVVSMRGGIDGERQIAAVRSVLEALPSEYGRVYLPHCTGDPGADDLALLHDPWLRDHLVAFDHHLGPRAAVALVEGAAVTCGTRFHLSVLAAAAGVPAIAVASDEYDVLRMRSIPGGDGVHVVDDRRPAELAAIVAAVAAHPHLAPAPRWDPAAFAEAVSDVLPPAPAIT